MAKKLKDKLEAHQTAFLQKQVEGGIGDSQVNWTAWFLDGVYPVETSRRKGTDDE